MEKRLPFNRVEFVCSAFTLKQLPQSKLPEIAFAGRSNVGKSSLLNRLLNRKRLVKTSSKPGKTQSLNYFLVDEVLHLVDLPGYGYAKVSQHLQLQWQEMITAYLLDREQLVMVVVIMDVRHSLKEYDRMLVSWLQHQHIPYLPVYTKADKLSGNQLYRNASALDAGLNISARARVLASARDGRGIAELQSRLAMLT
ncbi:MAG: GTP-binding protein [Desulfobulbus propionicus]|nr:MAG: GTP-binding protein [Desulfobulbus propionicus]